MRTWPRLSVVDIKKTKKAILDTFAHRETTLGIIDIADSEMKRIQNYWTIYLETISEEARADLSMELKDAVGEINEFVLEHGLVCPKQSETAMLSSSFLQGICDRGDKYVFTIPGSSPSTLCYPIPQFRS